MSQAFLSEASVLSRAVSSEAVLLPRAAKLSAPIMPDCKHWLSQLPGSSVQLWQKSVLSLRHDMSRYLDQSALGTN